MHYIKQLDTLRALAVFLVIIEHWFLKSHFLNQLFGNYTGGIGVSFFFVLSGFLITGILLKNKENSLNKAEIIKNFYVRRSLRIFPIYYLSVLIAFCFFEKESNTTLNGNLLYYLLYGSNFLVYLEQSWTGFFSHLWTLAVEEQFYLIWPCVIIFVPHRYVLKIIIVFIILGIGSNYILPNILPYNLYLTQLTPTCFDAFGLGGLLAYFFTRKKQLYVGFTNAIALLCIPTAIIYIFLIYFKIDLYVPARTLVSVLSLGLISYTIKERDNIVFRYLLNNKVLIKIGKFSYGIYLFHNFIPYIYGSSKLVMLPFLKNIIPLNLYGELRLIEYFGVTIVLAWLSFTLIETPINSLKRKFETKTQPNLKTYNETEHKAPEKLSPSRILIK